MYGLGSTCGWKQLLFAEGLCIHRTKMWRHCVGATGTVWGSAFSGLGIVSG